MSIGLARTTLTRLGACHLHTTLASRPVANPPNCKPYHLVTSDTRMAASEPPTPWHAAYPPPRNSKGPVAGVTRETMLEMLKDKDSVVGKAYILVDLRRTDYEGGTIRGSLNLPAQSLYPTIPTLYNMFRAAKLRRVIWYCSSSRGRGTRAAGWFRDYYLEDRNDGEMESLILLEGVAGWAQAGGEYVEWMDGYDAAVWAGK